MAEDFIHVCRDKCLNGIVLEKNDIIRLLSIPLGSEDDRQLRSAAREVSSALTEDRGCIWCAVGMDYAPCSMNCRFCSFGEAWGLIEHSRHVDLDEILAYVKAYVAGGAAYIVLRTTEFYSIDTLLEFVPKIREAVPGDYAIVFNTGELDPITCQRLYDEGVFGVYHALRLGEGVDTPFDPADRIATMQSVAASPLSLISLVEPIGHEHTNEEIAELLLNAVSCGAFMSGAMARFPVPGTPLGDTPMISEARLAQIIAVLRLSGGTGIKDICVHPASVEALNSGANVVVVEAGAIPRDACFSKREWLGVSMSRAQELLSGAGYRVSAPAFLQRDGQKKASCACCGGNLEKFMQPIILDILRKAPMNGYQTTRHISSYVTFEDAVPDAAATYRYLKQMKKRGLISLEKGKYSITESGRICLANWKNTLTRYQRTIDRLASQLSEWE